MSSIIKIKAEPQGIAPQPSLLQSNPSAKFYYIIALLASSPKVLTQKKKVSNLEKLNLPELSFTL